MRLFLIIQITIFFTVSSVGCHKHKNRPSFTAAKSKVFVKSVKYWDLIPEDSKSVFIAEYSRMPDKVRFLFQNIPLLAPPVSDRPDTAIIYWKHPKNPVLRGGIFAFPNNIKITFDSEYRGSPVRKITGIYYMTLLGKRLLFTGKKNDIFIAVDILKKKTSPGRFVYSDAASLTRYFKSSKISGLYLAELKSEDITFKSIKPLRAGVSLSFPLNWTVIKGVIVFGDNSDADTAVSKIAASIKRFAGNPLLKDIPWMMILKPLSVHSEGNSVYIQWAEKTDVFLKILALVKNFIIKHSKEYK